ncbi:MAG: response regulator transcription factor [Desulfobacterales bacterium]|nr:response regulator transcription factor [Desulfobacterales bacterium]
MPKKTSILLASDNIMFREGLSCLLSNDHRFKVSGETGSIDETLKAIKRFKADVVLLDSTLPELFARDAVGQIRKANASAQLIVMGQDPNINDIRHTIQAGALGFISKKAAFADLAKAIETVQNNERYISHEYMNALIQDFAKGEASKPDLARHEKLTKRERQIFEMVATGHDPEDIAKKLNISIKTYYKHRTNLMEKLEVSNMAQLVRFAFDSGLVKMGREK